MAFGSGLLLCGVALVCCFNLYVFYTIYDVASTPVNWSFDAGSSFSGPMVVPFNGGETREILMEVMRKVCVLCVQIICVCGVCVWNVWCVDCVCLDCGV